MKRMGLAGFALLAGLCTMGPGTSAASPIYLCIGTKAGQGVKSGGPGGTCPKPTEKLAYTPVALPAGAAEQETLLSILPYLRFVASGVGGKPTIQFSGVNVQVVNGEGKTASVNGEGNLVLGYDENGGGHEQTGSHNLVAGEEQAFTSYGGLLGGFRNSITAPFASITGGEHNLAGGQSASVSGGNFDAATALGASVSGGLGNWASVYGDSISGGRENTAAGLEANWIGGGYKNSVPGNLIRRASVFGGKEVSAKAEYEAIP